jgi:hypothetical protein
MTAEGLSVLLRWFRLPIMATIDRLVHHATILEFNNGSIRDQHARVRQKDKASASAGPQILTLENQGWDEELNPELLANYNCRRWKEIIVVDQKTGSRALGREIFTKKYTRPASWRAAPSFCSNSSRLNRFTARISFNLAHNRFSLKQGVGLH